MNTKIKLKVQGLTNSQVQSGAYALILSEEGRRRIPVIVGVSEAQSIAIALEGLQPPRPLTHDLFVRFAMSFHIQLLEVYIYKFEDSVFYSEMIFTDGTQEIRVDSRTSDAVAIALRMKCDIYTSETIMQKCGVVLDESQSTETEDSIPLSEISIEDIHDKGTLDKWLKTLQKEDLNERLEKAISDENYEFAKIYKEELQRREELKSKK